MTYQLNKSPLFRAYNTATQTGLTSGSFNLQEYVNCHKATVNTIQTSRAYVYGETRTSGYSNPPNLDVEFSSAVTAKQEGSQWWNNSVSTYAPIDDGVYAVVTEQTSLVVSERYNTGAGESDVEETRVFGIRMKP